MNLPPRNYLDNAPNSPSFHQALTADGQREATDNSNLATQASQAGAETMSQMRTAGTASNTAAHAADTALNYAKAEILLNAGLTQGSEAMAGLAQRYAPQGGNIATIAALIREGIGV